MKSFLYVLFSATVLFALPLSSAEKVVSELKSVNLVEVDKVNEEEHDYGSDYYAFNDNNYPVTVSIKLVRGVNVTNGLITGDLVISPKESGYLGWIVQKEAVKGGTWTVEWQVEDY